MKRMAKLNSQLQGGLAAADRVFALLDTPPSILDKRDAKALDVTSHDIRFQDVRFSYGQDSTAIRASTWTCRTAMPWRSSAPRVPANRRC